MKRIGVVTSARSDYGIYLPILRALNDASDFELQLYVTGMHLAPEFGSTVNTIERDGFAIHERVAMLLAADSPEGIAKSMGLGQIGFAQAFARSRPDVLMVLGDRFEMFAAASAALPFNLPLIHLHGGESTEGVIDEAFRHALTKMSHLHFVSTETYRQRVIQLGEQPGRVFVSGAPGLDNLRGLRLLDPQEIESRHGLRITKPFLLVTFHPVTLEPGSAAAQIEELLAALDESGLDLVFTYPNADAESSVIIRRIREFAASRPRVQVAINLGMTGYFSVMAQASAMVGNSSSGIIEAASFHLPVVNIGDRQRGRVAGPNVLHVEPARAVILDGIRRALKLDLAGLTNPYGDGHATERIMSGLRAMPPAQELLHKRFYDLPS